MHKRHTIEKLGEKFSVTKSEIIASCAGEGSHKRLYIRIHYDGVNPILNGFVEFVVEDHDKEEAYTTFDGAVEAYNAAA